MKLKDIILIGAGGHAFSCIDIIESHNKYNIAGLVDNKKNIIYDFKYPLLGNDADLVQLKKSYKLHISSLGKSLIFSDFKCLLSNVRSSISKSLGSLVIKI